MFRPASRLVARQSAVRAFPRTLAPSRRLLSTAPPAEKSRSWKSLAARLGIAGALIYSYNSTDLFAEEPRVIPVIPETDNETEILPTIDAIAEERRRRKAEAAEAAAAAAAEKEKATQTHEETAASGSVEELEEEAEQQGAFNPETGEINWDCPCLGGMAHGPCGEEFKAAFSCFVYSTEEPKGMDCVEKFKDMQNCFRQYPEIYGSELDTDENDDVTADEAQLPAPDSENPSPELASVSSTGDSESREQRALAATEQVKQDYGDSDKHYTGPATKNPQEPRSESATEPVSPPPAEAKKEQKAVSESNEVIPKAWHDERDANVEMQKKEKKATK
ncbi:uncharacterized protein EI97DRAFT_491928 [Westerdykella ornata]|uniref:Mitochondrial intermembrane space import and assembly protein 40 n=1 Tax=Westerdykella ornata TaxID=318751 RepID=A0A6A6JSG7_WESOR|nr:uncharacterized protein EI97DRAFT_491928 [Westerdykella ornata]KAF2279204.1 hypothetical protein EI97DRAFT_491928 [Westerdykella ornata]